MSGKPRHPNLAARATHMARRNSQGLSVRKVADEFDVSKTTAHRWIQGHRQRAEQMLKDGYEPRGSAADEK